MGEYLIRVKGAKHPYLVPEIKAGHLDKNPFGFKYESGYEKAENLGGFAWVAPGGKMMELSPEPPGLQVSLDGTSTGEDQAILKYLQKGMNKKTMIIQTHFNDKEPHNFPSRTFGLGSKYWIPIGWTVFGIGVLLLFNSSTRSFGVRMLFPGWMLAFYAKVNQFPLLTITSNSISLRKGITTDYHVFERKDLLRIDRAKKAFTIIPKEGKPLKIPSWVFRKRIWKEIQELLQEFAKQV